ncbi:MAG: glucosaminidase domain-containing protein, partial [Desulfobulbaceae bacterium]|nr:glucosaminidase domain-containing protein [Desulfobulbaceae bacterium]
MGSRNIDYVKVMNNISISGFSAKGDLKIYKRLVIACFALAAISFPYTMLTAQPKINKLQKVAAATDTKVIISEQPKKPELSAPKSYTTIYAKSSKELINKLQKHHLWKSPLSTEIPAVILDSYPAGLNDLTVPEKKKAFLHSLLPIALTALAEVADERRQLLDILDKYPAQPKRFATEEDDNSPNWKKPLSSRETKFIKKLTKKYRTTSVTGLLSRVNTVPISLILAQGAIESSWGSSRFAHKGNNLFGIWTWGKQGMVPAQREEGKNHLVASYDSLLDSVRAYILMLNRVKAYTQLRAIRKKTSDPVAMAAGLLNYSERGGVYVSDIGRIIDYNNLRDFDSFTVV